MLPFIRASARPALTSSTALAAESWLCWESTISKEPISSEARPATSHSRAAGPTRMGFSRPSRAASTALSRETASQGCTTAVAIAGCLPATSISRSYLACGRAAAVAAASGMGDFQRLRPSLDTEQRFDASQASQPFLGQGAARAEHLQQGVERGPAGLLAVGQQPGNGTHGALLVEADEEILLLQAGLQLGHAHAVVDGLNGADRLQRGEAALVDAAFGHAHIDEGAQHRLRQAADLEAALELDPHLGLVGLAHQLAVDPPRARRMLGAQPDHGLQQRRAVDTEEHRLGHGVARLL